MSLWKQLAIALVILVVAAGGWVRFFPGAPETLERWGLDWAASAVPERAAGQATQQRGAGDGAPQQQAAVVAARIRTATINDRLTAIGTGRAANTVSVTPFASGRLVEMRLEPGARVRAGDLIARLDSDAEEITVDRARMSLADAVSRLERVQALRASNTASAVQVNEAQLAVSNAELALRDAELSLERRSVKAPISGVVGILPVSAGNYVTTQTEIATIDDRARIIIDFWVPERFATMVSVGQDVSAVSVARPNQVFSGAISAVDSRIDAQSRTLRVQARLENEDDLLRAGMSFQVTMSFPGDTYPAVDPLAIQWGTDGAFIWLVEDGKARRAPVRIIQRNTDSVLVAGDFRAAVSVVTEGIHAVREGAALRLVDNRGADEPVIAPPSTTGS